MKRPENCFLLPALIPGFCIAVMAFQYEMHWVERKFLAGSYVKFSTGIP